MTVEQVSLNHAAVAQLAERLTALGYQGDDVHRVAESIAVNLLAAGYKRLTRQSPQDVPGIVRGPGSTETARRDALVAAQRAVDAARARRLGAGSQDQDADERGSSETQFRDSIPSGASESPN